MKKTLLTLTTLLVLVAGLFILTGCEKKSSKPIVGSWKYGTTDSFVYTFNEDGTGSYAGKSFKYEDKGDKLSIIYDGDTAGADYGYRIEGNKLIIKDSFDNDVEYTRK